MRSLLFAARGIDDKSRLRLGGCDNPAVAFSTARPLARDGAYRLRAYSSSPATEQARFVFPHGMRARLVDLAGRRVARRDLKRLSGGAIQLQMRSFEIVTFEVAAT
ncbi:MAG TPA: hypothetical protein VIX12_09760 [Candidatus Binataceae bacterium]